MTASLSVALHKNVITAVYILSDKNIFPFTDLEQVFSNTRVGAERFSKNS